MMRSATSWSRQPLVELLRECDHALRIIVVVAKIGMTLLLLLADVIAQRRAREPQRLGGLGLGWQGDVGVIERRDLLCGQCR